MVDISSILSQRPSPQEMMQKRISDQVDSGQISETDEDAILEALDEISSEMAPDSTSASSGPPPSPEEMAAKLDSLLQDQIDAGNLTEDQAATLKEVMTPPPPPPPGGAPMEMGGSTGTSASSDELNSALSDLLDQLQSQSGYTEDGDTTTSDLGSVLFSYTA